jgi:hypothetical protein
MTTATFTVRSKLAGLACAAVLSIPAIAAGQAPTVQPDGTLSNPAAPPPQPTAPAQPAKPVIIQQGKDGKATVIYGDDGQQGPDGYYFGADEGGFDRTRQNWDVKLHGPVPEHHVIRKGDTLWDLSWLYFNDPWQWPKVWSYNPSITNPHWIYPGDLLRLYPPGEAPVVVAPQDPDDPIDVAEPVRRASYNVSLRQLAYVDLKDLKFAGTIVGAVDDKIMLSVGDHVYVDYPEGKPPKVGKRFAIYTETQPVKHPDGSGQVGSYVRLLGELRILSVKKDKRARAEIEQANDVIERGHRVGPIQKRYRGDTIAPRANAKNLTGTVLAMLKNDQLIGEGEIVFIDLGKKTGIKQGNILHVVRRGDAYDTVRGGRGKVGQDDEAYPSRSIGRVMILEVGTGASAAIVLESTREFEPGDRVLMRKSK